MGASAPSCMRNRGTMETTTMETAKTTETADQKTAEHYETLSGASSPRSITDDLAEVLHEAHSDHSHSSLERARVVSGKSKELSSTKLVHAQSKILNAWFIENLHGPYPDKHVKKELAERSGATPRQVH